MNKEIDNLVELGNKYIDNLVELGNKYNFKINVGNKYNFKININETVVSLIALNTDNKEVEWINYNIQNDTVSYLGNTDNCNLWFCETRKDFTPKKCIEFVSDLNTAFELPKDYNFLLKNLVGPEDWQEIANIHDAYEDERYNQK